MKFLKSILALCLALGLTLALFACEEVDKSDSESSGSDKKSEYTFVMPDGAPVLAAANLMKNYPEIDGHKINYKIVPAENIGPEFIKNSEIAIIPTNAAAKLYNKNKDSEKTSFNLLSVNVFGVLYMVGVGVDEITDLNMLKGEVVYNIGQGKTPDLLLKYFLKNANIDYVESEVAEEGKVALAYKDNATEIIPLLKQGKAKFGVLGQPVANISLTKVDGAKIVFDFQKAWKDITGKDSYPQAGVVVKKSVANDKEFINALYNALSENKKYIEENPADLTDILTEYNSTLKDKPFDTETVKACNLDCKKASEAKESLVDYFNKIVEFDKSFIGGALPDDGFYLDF